MSAVGEVSKMMPFFSVLVLVLAPLLNAYNLHVHDASFEPDSILRVTAANISVACHERYTVLVNGTSPGPELRFRAGKSKWIRVYNDMRDQNLTMHWHGLSQAAYPFSDGTPKASQWPIPPLHYFDYELQFKIDQAGTYFYHSHVGFQAVSATGPLIIEDYHGHCPYEYHEDRTLFLTDAFNKTDTQVESGLRASPFVWSGETNAVLVNGHGIGNAQAAPLCNTSTCGLAKISIDPGKTYRFRFIGATALSFLSVGVQDHDMKIIEADGAYTKAHKTNILQIGSGQRFSTLLQGKTCEQLKHDKKTEYYIQLETRDRPANTTAFAVLSYNAKKCHIAPTILSTSTIPATSPITLPPTQLGWLDYQLAPFHKDNGFPSLSEVTRRVTITVHQIISDHIVWQENNHSWTEEIEAVPYLVALYLDSEKYIPSLASALAHGGIDPRTTAFPAEIGEVLEIVIQNSGATNGGLDYHPFHAHGAHYYDIGSGNGTYNVTANEKRLVGVTPVKRDTTMLYKYGTSTIPGANAGWRAWRLRVTDPGVWMIHCHILQHMIMGMQTAWVFGNASDILKVPPPMVQGYLVYGGDVNGNATHWPRVVHFHEGT